ncbi:MAG: hypothetical protein RL030_1903 [Pseudomonadota bacterium]
MRRPGIFALLLSGLIATQQASAMTFTIVRTADGSHGVSASGEIVAGDARRMRAAMAFAHEDASGSRRLFLDSPGGSVAEALEMVPILNRMKVTTVVGSGAVCASSCSAVVFISGFRRVVQRGGLLGFHTCHARSSRVPLPGCNDAIADNAMAHGVSWGTALLFQRAASPAGMVWLGKAEAECWGLADSGLQDSLRTGSSTPLRRTPDCLRIAAVPAAHTARSSATARHEYLPPRSGHDP